MYNGILKDTFSNISLLKIVIQSFVKQTIHVDVFNGDKKVYTLYCTQNVYTLYSIQKCIHCTVYKKCIHCSVLIYTKKIHKKIYIMLIKKRQSLTKGNTKQSL